MRDWLPGFFLLSLHSFFSYSAPSCAAYLCLLPDQSKGMWFRHLSCCAWYSLPPPQWSINHRTVSWCIRRWTWPVRRPSSWPITFCCCVHSCTVQRLQSEPLSFPFLASELVLLCHLWLQLFCPSHLLFAVSRAVLVLWEWRFWSNMK